MPNWVYNTLTIQGPKSEIDYIKDRLNRPFTLAQETFGMGDISLSGFPTKIEQVDWYSWNNSNWGTKWDVAVRDGDEYPNTELLEYKSEGEDNWVVYKYETAWSPAVTILTKLSNMVPNSLLTLEFEEETGWGGEYEILRGEVKELAEWDNRCYACQSFDTLEYCDDDCGEFCSECNEGSWQDEEAMAKCQTHSVLLESRKKAEV